MAALPMESTRPMMQRTIPAVATPFRGPVTLLIPSTKPVMVFGKPMIGRSQASSPNRPRHNDAIAFPPPAGVRAEPGGLGTAADGGIMVGAYHEGAAGPAPRR